MEKCEHYPKNARLHTQKIHRITYINIHIDIQTHIQALKI